MDYTLKFKDQVSNLRSKFYFEEVEKSFRNGCYRSATVSLWSVLLFDVLEKLSRAHITHNDQKAKNVLNEIEKLQKANKNSPDWETKIIKYLADNEIIGSETEAMMESLQKIRHLSAHPAIDRNNELFTPSREQIYAYIDFFCREVFSTDAFGSKKTFNIFVTDLESMKERLLADQGNGAKLVSQLHLEKMSGGARLSSLRSLWRMAFRTQDKRSIDNRDINTFAIRCLYEFDKNRITDNFKDDPKYYSEIHHDDDSLFVISNEIFAPYPELFSLLTAPVRLDIKKFVEANFDHSWSFPFTSKEYIYLSIDNSTEQNAQNSLIPEILIERKIGDEANAFIEYLMQKPPSLRKVIGECYLNKLLEHDFLWKNFESKILAKLWNGPTAAQILKKCTHDQIKHYLERCNIHYSNALNYDSADARFEQIESVLDFYDKDCLDHLVSVVTNPGNSQCLDRRGMKRDHGLVSRR